MREKFRYYSINFYFPQMLTTQLLSGVRTMGLIVRRNYGVTAVAMGKVTDPIQALFIEKVREYKKRSKDGKLVDPTPEIMHELKQELDKLAKNYGGGEGVDMTKFPEFKFEEPKVDPINATA